MRSTLQVLSGALWVVCAAALASACGVASAVAEDSVPPVEACAHKAWGYLYFTKHHFGTVNTCADPITIWFMLKSGKTIHKNVDPKGVFDAGVPEGKIHDWAAAVCPRGTAPQPEVSLDNWDAIEKGRYVCTPTK